MGNRKALEPEQRDYQWLFDKIRIIIGDVVNPLKEDINEMKQLTKETRDKLNSKVEIVIQDNVRINTLEKKFEEEKKAERFNWTKALSVVSILIAFMGAGTALLIFLRG